MKALDTIAVSVRQGDVLRDFCEAAYCAIAKTTTLDKARQDDLESRYMRVVDRYCGLNMPKAMETFAEMLGEMTLALEERGHDFLGTIFQELNVANARSGQFFTPDTLSYAMAMMTLGDKAAIEQLIAKRGFFTLCEPACGAGGMVIQAAEVLKSYGFNPARHMHATMIDIDPTCFHMAFLQVSLLGINAGVILGNSISLEMRESAWTPAAILFPWPAKDADDPARSDELTPAAPPLALPAPAQPATAGKAQLDLFGPREAAE